MTLTSIDDLMFAFWSCESPNSLIYMVRNPDSGAVKIGRTTNLEKRLADLRTAIPGLQFICSFAGGSRTEADLHASFQEDCIGGEWFRPSLALASLAVAARRRSA